MGPNIIWVSWNYTGFVIFLSLFVAEPEQKIYKLYLGPDEIQEAHLCCLTNDLNDLNDLNDVLWKWKPERFMFSFEIKLFHL